MISEEQTNLTHYRYPGVKPFSIGENELFFGRESDLDALSTLIFIRQTVVLYGKSGYGKSSLINAGIIPELQNNLQCVYFTIRFNNYSEKEQEQNLSPLQTIKRRLAEQINLSEDNILDQLINGEDSFWYWIKKHQLQKEGVNFLLFFDQFEELFTYPKSEIAEFSSQLSEVLYNTIPLKFKKQIASLGEININDNEHDFLYEKPDVKVLFSVRSDRLSLLNGLTDQHPAILQHCYELDALNEYDARKAITEPARLHSTMVFRTPPFTYSENALIRILNSIANPLDKKIEASTLQIVCRWVEDNLVANQKRTHIEGEDLGDITDIFQQYYEGILAKLTLSDRLQAQHLIEDELIDGDRRNPLSAAYIKNKFKLSESLLDQLEQSSLLRKERDATGRILYEVSHDTLITAINKVAEDRRQVEKNEINARLELEIKQERHRVEELGLIKDKALMRYKIAVIMAISSVLMMGIAVFYATKASNNEKIAEENTRKVELQKDEMTKAYRLVVKEHAMSVAKDLQSSGNRYLSNRNKDDACKRYQEALDTIHNYPTEALYQELLTQIKSTCHGK